MRDLGISYREPHKTLALRRGQLSDTFGVHDLGAVRVGTPRIGTESHCDVSGIGVVIYIHAFYPIAFLRAASNFGADFFLSLIRRKIPLQHFLLK